ncbi:DNA translocase FtsK [Rufibacter tibetensis]|nr:DNA translocase FtsK [Rufibacter tibetensis]
MLKKLLSLFNVKSDLKNQNKLEQESFSYGCVEVIEAGTPITSIEETNDSCVKVEAGTPITQIEETNDSCVEVEAGFVLTEEEINFFIEEEVSRMVSNERLNKLELDPLIKEAAYVISTYQQASSSLIQRKLKLGYNRTGRIIDQLEHLGIIGGFNGVNAREVLVGDLDEIKNILTRGFEYNPKKEYFLNNILPLKKYIIEEKVKEYYEKVEIENVKNLKRKLREEILAKEEEKKEKDKRETLRQQIIDELLIEGFDIEQGLTMKREPIPQAVQDLVWNRDKGQCVNCGSKEKLEFDHIIPFSKGGSNTYRNLQLLCEKCNRQKSNKIG